MNENNSSPTLVRQLTFTPLFYFVVASMVGVGIFTTSGFVIRDVGHPLLMVGAWILGGLFALCGALCYSELGTMFPMAGGDYAFLREAFGKRVAFLSGWISLLAGFSAPAAAVAVAFALYISAAFPDALAGVNPQIIAVSLIVVMTFVHSLGLRFGARTQNYLSAFKIVLILSMVAGGLLWGTGSFDNFGGEVDWSTMFSSPFATSLIFISFAYSGWNASAYLGEEVKNPERNIPFSILAGTICVLIMYVALNVVFVFAVPAAQMSGVGEVGHLAATAMFGEDLGAFYSLAIAFSLLSTLGAYMVTGPRVYYAMARDHLLFNVFGRVHAKTRVPLHAILLQSAISIIMVLTATFDALLFYIGVLLSIVSAMAVLGMMYLRLKRPDIPRSYKTWGYPVTPIVFIGFSIWIIIFSVTSNIWSVLWSVTTIVTGFLLYHVYERFSKA